MEETIQWGATLFVLVSVQNCDGQKKWGWDCDVRNSQDGSFGKAKEENNLQDFGRDDYIV